MWAERVPHKKTRMYIMINIADLGRDEYSFFIRCQPNPAFPSIRKGYVFKCGIESSTKPSHVPLCMIRNISQKLEDY